MGDPTHSATQAAMESEVTAQLWGNGSACCNKLQGSSTGTRPTAMIWRTDIRPRAGVPPGMRSESR